MKPFDTKDKHGIDHAYNIGYCQKNYYKFRKKQTAQLVNKRGGDEHKQQQSCKCDSECFTGKAIPMI